MMLLNEQPLLSSGKNEALFATHGTLVCLGLILYSIGFSGISVMVAAAAKSQETFWGIINFLGMPLFLLSPALFPLALMPDWLASIAAFNPVSYTVILVREMMSGFVEGWSALLSVSILVAFSVIMIGLASYVFTRDVNKPF